MATYTGIGAAFGSFFGSNDLDDAYGKALMELAKFREQATQSVEGFRSKGQSLYDKAISSLTDPTSTMSPDLQAMRSMLITNMSSGLSPLAKTYMEDANRFLEGRAISTGNLRSGAIGLQRAQLGQRVVNDEFTRALGVLDTLRKGDQMTTDSLLRGSLGYAQNENVALNSLGNAANSIAGAEVGRGMVDYNKSVALGTAIGGLTDKAEEYLKMYFTGGASSLMGGGGGT